MQTPLDLPALALAIGLAAQGKAVRLPRANARKIIGTWTVRHVKGSCAPSYMPIEFTEDGRVRMVMGHAANGKRVSQGTYQLEGTRLRVTRWSGKRVTTEYTIRRLTADQLVLAFDGGRQEHGFVRFEPLA